MSFAQSPVTFVIIIITVLISMRAFKDDNMKYKWLFIPYRIDQNKEAYRIISHIFIHGDYMHLLFNMIVLFSFGSALEGVFKNVANFGPALGSMHYVILYFLGGLAASIWPFIRNRENPNYMSLGASGAVSAVLFATILWMPYNGIYLLFIPFEIPAWLFGILYLGFEFYMSKKGGGRIAHDAHFGGAIFGILYVLFINFPKGMEFINYIFS